MIHILNHQFIIYGNKNKNQKKEQILAPFLMGIYRLPGSKGSPAARGA